MRLTLNAIPEDAPVNRETEMVVGKPRPWKCACERPVQQGGLVVILLLSFFCIGWGYETDTDNERNDAWRTTWSRMAENIRREHTPRTREYNERRQADAIEDIARELRMERLRDYSYSQ